MIVQPEWIANTESLCMLQWTDFLRSEAKRLFHQDGTHANILFSFDKEKGLISVNIVPPNTDHGQLNATIIHTVKE